MRKKMVSGLCTLLLAASLAVSVGAEATASESVRVVDGSKLTHEAESIGMDTKVTRGEYLQTGYSKIARLGPGKIYAGGTTIAEKTVESVRLSVMVERCPVDEDAWYFVDGWQKENKNNNLVSDNRSLRVEGGYYYRVRSYHAAQSDVSSSFTDGIFIEKP